MSQKINQLLNHYRMYCPRADVHRLPNHAAASIPVNYIGARHRFSSTKIIHQNCRGESIGTQPEQSCPNLEQHLLIHQIGKISAVGYC